MQSNETLFYQEGEWEIHLTWTNRVLVKNTRLGLRSFPIRTWQNPDLSYRHELEPIVPDHLRRMVEKLEDKASAVRQGFLEDPDEYTREDWKHFEQTRGPMARIPLTADLRFPKLDPALA